MRSISSGAILLQRNSSTVDIFLDMESGDFPFAWAGIWILSLLQLRVNGETQQQWRFAPSQKGGTL